MDTDKYPVAHHIQLCDYMLRMVIYIYKENLGFPEICPSDLLSLHATVWHISEMFDL